MGDCQFDDDLQALQAGLDKVDPESFKLIQAEINRDVASLNLDAAENYPTRAVNEAADAPIGDAEGYPGKRFHAGKQYIDTMERLCWKRALETFQLDESQWGVNVQVLSGSLANVFSYIALLEPGDVVMALELSHGGHISHGYQTATKKLSETAIRFKAVPYQVDLDTGLIDYDGLEKLASLHRPKIITVGGSSYSRLIDFQRVRSIADSVGCMVHCDMAHFCGLVAAGVIPSPFPFSDLVTTTTSKTFRGPDAAMIFFRRWMEERINQTVFPRFQAGADHSNIIALAVALLQAQTPASRRQQRLVVDCAQAFARQLLSHGYKLSGGGTDTHLVLLDLRPNAISANRVERVLELLHIYCNRNVVPNDKPGSSSGIRFGTAPMVSRGMGVEHLVTAANFVHKGIEAAKAISREAIGAAVEDEVLNPRSFQVFTQYLGDGSSHSKIVELRTQVCALAEAFPPPRNM